MIPKLTQQDINRFWRGAYVKNSDSCWFWLASKDTAGYGLFRINKKLYKAHRIAYNLHYNKIIKNLICHTCDNPDCVNPYHLFQGTKKINAQDRDKKNRGKLPYQYGKQRKHLISIEKENEIRNKYEINLYSIRELAKIYNVSHTVIWRIIHNVYRR